jgi:hypothetical protein
MSTLRLLFIAMAVAFSTTANAVVLVKTGDPGFYNNSIGTVLNGTNGGETGPFPVSNDSNLTFPTAPDLSAANSALGNWLTEPDNLNANWNFLTQIPNRWTVGTEAAVIYRFTTLSATNVVAKFGVDNGIFVWLDGNYIGGARRAGGVSLGEHVYNIGDLSAGTHYLQLLLEDHGTTNGYAVEITADTFIPTPDVELEKTTNGSEADDANDSDVPRIQQGATVTWAYEVTNTGSVVFSEAEIAVTDSQPGVTPVLDVSTDDGDMNLSPAETWTYTASAQAVDLTNPPPGVTIVPGCKDDRNTYENMGRVDILGTDVFDEDLSHYCNASDSDSDGISDYEDNCVLIANGPLDPDAGGNSQRDTDGDGYGNICDPDFDNSGNVDFSDLAVLKSRFFTSDPDADLDGDGTVDFADLALLKSMFFGPPGPSGLVP